MSNFNKGDKVFDIRYGWGRVHKTMPGNVEVYYPKHSSYKLYTDDGKSHRNDCSPTLSHTEYHLEGFDNQPVCLKDGDKFRADYTDYRNSLLYELLYVPIRHCWYIMTVNYNGICTCVKIIEYDPISGDELHINILKKEGFRNIQRQ